MTPTRDGTSRAPRSELEVFISTRESRCDYDEWLARGWERSEARERVRDEVERVLAGWQRP